jgi:hypothetical protein
MITRLLLNARTGAVVVLIAVVIAAWHRDWAVAALVVAGFMMLAMGGED